MLCPNCGKELADNAAFCAGCGTRMGAAATEAPAPAPTVTMEDFIAKVKKVFGSGLFLAMAILSTLAALQFAGANIFATLTAIAMWIIFGAAKTEKSNCLGGLKFSSGILKAKSIVNWILIVTLCVVLAILLVVIPMVKNIIEEVQDELNREFEEVIDAMPKDFDVEKALDELLDELYKDEDAVKELEKIGKRAGMDLDRDSVEEMFDKFGIRNMEKGIDWMVDNKDDMFSKIIDTTFTVLMVTFAVSIVLLIVFNVLIIGRLRKFARSACQAVEANDAKMLNLKLLRSTLVAAGIFTLSTPFAAAACFVGVALVNKLRAEISE